MKKVYILFSGDRNWTAEAPVRARLTYLLTYFSKDEIVIVHGDARGLDRMAGHIAEEIGYEVKLVPAEWHLWGRAAGPIRNQKMLHEYRPRRLYAFHDDISKSKGTKNMIHLSRSAGVQVVLVNSQNQESSEYPETQIGPPLEVRELIDSLDTEREKK